jgi:nucleotide-binding universal stress UspA family protein
VLTHVRRSSRVTVVRAYTDDRVIGEPLAPSTEQAGPDARAELEQQVAAVLQTVPERHPMLDLTVVPGDPRSVLRTAADGADLLVIGARGRGVIDHLLLGSVASALAHHPSVPTIVVPIDAARTPAD